MAITFHHATPVLRVGQLGASLEYYIQVLGFTLDWEDRGITASVSRGPCNLMLCQGDQGHPGTWVWVGVGDADALYQELRLKGARIRRPPTNYWWALELQVEDPDGNVLRFGSESRSNEPYGPWLDMYGTFWQLRDDAGPASSP